MQALSSLAQSQLHSCSQTDVLIALSNGVSATRQSWATRQCSASLSSAWDSGFYLRRVNFNPLRSINSW